MAMVGRVFERQRLLRRIWHFLILHWCLPALFLVFPSLLAMIAWACSGFNTGVLP